MYLNVQKLKLGVYFFLLKIIMQYNFFKPPISITFRSDSTFSKEELVRDILKVEVVKKGRKGRSGLEHFL